MDAMQFLRGVDNPMQPYALPHLGLVPDYQQRLQALYPGQSIAQLEQNAYDANRAEFDRLLALGRPDVLQGWIRSRLQGSMYEDMEELAFAVGRSVDELQYYLSADPLELLRQAEAQQEAARLAEIAANAERIRLQQIEEQRAAEARVRQWELEAQQLVAESAARQAAQTAQRIAQAEKQLRDELRAQWPAGDIDAQVTIYNQLLTQPPRSHAEVESILRDVLGEGAELQTLLRYTRAAQQGISLAETAAQIAREEAEAPIRAFQAATQAELQKTLQYIAESGSVPVEEMIATGAYTQAQIDLAAQVQARQLAAQQEATRLDLERQEAERRARVLAEIAQAQAEEQAAIQAYIAQQQAERKAELIKSGEMPLQQMIATGLFTSDEIAQAAQVQQAQAVSVAPTLTPTSAEVLTMDSNLENVLAQGIAEYNAKVQAVRNKIAEIAKARVAGQSYALPIWSIDYPEIPAILIDSLLAQFGQPTIAELEAELAASQAAASGVDQSRGIDATIVVTAPAAPSDAIFPDTSSLVPFPGDADSYAQPVVTTPVVTTPVVTTPVVTAPAAGGGAALLLALASAYFLGA